MSMVCLLENEHTKDQALVHMSVCSNWKVGKNVNCYLRYVVFVLLYFVLSYMEYG